MDDTVAEMGTEFRAGRYEDGLVRAIDAVAEALACHFPAAEAGETSPPLRENQLPDRPVIR